MFTYVKRKYKVIAVTTGVLLICTGFYFAKKIYSDPDFGKTFGPKAIIAEKKLVALEQNFTVCAAICKNNSRFIQSIVFPEVMRYNSLKDGIEAESLRTLYVELGEEYANFSIGLFQMKPTFAVQVEEKAEQLLPAGINKELQLAYSVTEQTQVRRERVNRLQDDDWQMVYLTAFICICEKLYAHKTFTNDTEKMQWFATVYNAGFERTDDYITKKITASNFYLQSGMPGKKYNYAAIAKWYYTKK